MMPSPVERLITDVCLPEATRQPSLGHKVICSSSSPIKGTGDNLVFTVPLRGDDGFKSVWPLTAVVRHEAQPPISRPAMCPGDRKPCNKSTLYSG